MRALLQRVHNARVTVDGTVTGEIGEGLLILICAMQGDGQAEVEALATKIAKLRIFKDAEGKMNRSIKDIGGSALIVSQFTLAADTTRGNRPGFSNAAPPSLGDTLYQAFIAAVTAQGIPTASGVFGADMDVNLTNAGPVTVWLDTAD